MAVGYKGKAVRARRTQAREERRQPEGAAPARSTQVQWGGAVGAGQVRVSCGAPVPQPGTHSGGELSKMGEAGMHTGGWAARRGAAAAGRAAATRHLLGIEAVSWEGAPC